MNASVTPKSPLAPIPSWLQTMRDITGVREYQGDADNPFILGMAAAIGEAFPDLIRYCKEYNNDAIPWCGLTVAYVMAVNGFKPVTKAAGAHYGFLWADDWKYFGQPSEARPGAVMVFTRNGGGHVALLEAETKNGYRIRGGNQADAVNEIDMAKNKLTAIRWPNTTDTGIMGRV